MTSHLIAIIGASGSGKTTLSRYLCQALGERTGETINCISQDVYYRDYTHLSAAERGRVNFDHPDSFDFAALAGDLSRLAAGEAVCVPEYDYVTHRPRARARHVASGGVLLVEGILLLHDPRVRELFSTTIYLDLPLALCFERRLERDVRERGRSAESVRRQFSENVVPMFERYLAPQRQHAQWVLDNNDAPSALVDALVTRLAKCKV
ncbi:uridine kinase [Gilvimarinus algae]|uniref:uridine/cytidine kinase n=1 Tax=Gilvimarinus algae TaxID=3058037 RepID=A0ABT8THC4_9GAMM|nr:uridine kinase [Gilvimarinus sp. SDUM040014]MDO3382091.1 uridine kinase [Gilvimarinus sp. SDUM040014]